MINVVVGLDTSPAAAEALRWAAGYARAVGGDLHAVHAYVSAMEGFLLPSDLAVTDTSQNQPEALQPPDEVTRLFQSVHPEPPWTLQCFAGEPGPLLRAQSERADLLVVGTGEHVGLGRLLVGSVSRYCLSHSSCPVVAVPAPHLVGKTGFGS
jgi:nucleotide-binding universal stress UspA family protein